MILIGLLVLAYLLGSTPTSLLLARLRGIDLRRWGSGNLGATNLYRAVGLPLAFLCALIDVGKGFVPAWYFVRLDGVDAPQLALAYGVAAILGHVFSIWVKFRGGKGVATGAGVYLALAPLAVAMAAVIWLVVMLTIRIASVGSLLAASAFPILIWVSGNGFDFVFWSSLPLTCFVWWTHRSNLRRLAAGREPRTARAERGMSAEATSESEIGTGKAASEA
ncbi:MAG: glycerol-3-phosphate 1-O-acyltransferase PlsY [Gemmatimonadetes bacterium]|uniref:Glycerol-3-phosphate acyltransferase n=1 Tax=Candidatus Kutchimonas denitrificans TaxID=3056748 RepID=A0AAE4Z7U2_9BACT|nr:glycerol-3-phosphate 1-O-acyltransferase PlsY [Gemmatimonadota bacterium]NIR75263.1 glycerol-3-phosphate 1-O-acyltransferase PlsY [Candidatus Kutchimonas denitrificans]NIS00201.1 glycerol-3-phosphate 1-O-acyltransferase PlsY [Gemmatimonadota bacterium]NIT65793.1 glycerol-3-phosphate 1-O-acyltransferase PlsY [Gemmatimonadota bacterium]NIU53071.1 glycerol-3-phosphate 1-O-acyltransferase PlsY [Gemmatimonadota bacterium]